MKVTPKQSTHHLGGKASVGGKLGPVELGGEVTYEKGWIYSDQNGWSRTEEDQRGVTWSFSGNIGEGCYIKPYATRYDDAFKSYVLRREEWASQQVESDRFEQYSTELESFDSQQYSPDPYESTPVEYPTSEISDEGLLSGSRFGTDFSSSSFDE